MKKKLQIMILLSTLLFISCEKKSINQIITKLSESNKSIAKQNTTKQTSTKQVEWKSLEEKTITHTSRFSAYDENGKYIAGLFDENLKVVYLGKEVDGILPFHEGYCIAIKSPEKGTMMQISAIDNTGKKLFSYETNYIYEINYRNGYFGRSDDFDLDSNGQEVTIAIFHDGLSLTFFDGNLCGYIKEDGTLLKNKSGKIIKEKYCDRYFYNGFAVIGDNYKDIYGLINKNGEEILPKEYSYLSKVEFGNVVASKRKNWIYKSPDFGLLSLNGDWIIEDKYYNFFQLSEELVAVVVTPLENCKYYETYEKSINFIPKIKIVNLKSNVENIIYENIVIDDNNYHYFKCFNDGVAVFFRALGTNKVGFGLISYEGKIILNPEYDTIDYYPDNGYWQVKKDGKWYLFKEGKGLFDPMIYLNFSEVQK